MLFPRLIAFFFSTCFFLTSIFIKSCYSQTSSSSYDSFQPPFSVLLKPHQTHELKNNFLSFDLIFNIHSPWKISLLSASLIENDFRSLIFPDINSLGSDNIENIQLKWPKPLPYIKENYNFLEYTGKFSVLLNIKKIDSHRPCFLKLNLIYSLCADQCIPIQHTLSLKVPVSSSPKKYDNQIKPNQNIFNFEIFQFSYHWMMICWAFIGGIILNFMPCVLPVLSFKFLSLIKQRHHFISQSYYRLKFLTTFAGIMISFVCLALLTILFKTLGITLGWGMHFQQPSFLMILIFFLTLFSNSFWGFYDIILPEKLNSKINLFFQNSSYQHQEFLQDFLLGIFATLLATPCTAPFLGTAFGYAFSQSNFDIFIFFIVLGFGFSLPYWAGACLPQHWLKLPKPGKWMARLSHFMGLILGITIIWLIWLLNQVGSLYQFVITSTAMILMTYLFWQAKEKPQLKKIIFISTSMLMILLLIFSTSPKKESFVAVLPLQKYWQVFEPSQIPNFIDQGKTVVVDITAAWCFTCKINKLVTFKSQEAKEMLSNPNIIFMQADWTHHQPDIAHYINKYDRAGIPFTIVFGPLASQGILLPEILTFDRLKQAILQSRDKN